MTTSWAWLVRGELKQALAANAGGALLGMLAAAGIPWLLVSAAVGRWLPWQPGVRTAILCGGTVLAVTMAQWGWRLATY